MPKLLARIVSLAGGLLALCAMGAHAATTESLNSAMQLQAQINNAAAQSQQQVDKLSDQTQEMLEEYQLTVTQTERLQVYNDQLERLIRDQEENKASITKQLGGIEIVEKEIVPLMLRMIDSLAQFVKLDVPFLIDERTARVETLKSIMDRSDVTVSEKYRQIMDAYSKEVDYGRTIEAYRGVMTLEGEERQVDYLRVGRILLAYQTLDGSATGFWNKNTRQWEPLDDSYRGAISDGLRVARKQTAPDLLTIPVSGPETAQ